MGTLEELDRQELASIIAPRASAVITDCYRSAYRRHDTGDRPVRIITGSRHRWRI